MPRKSDQPKVIKVAMGIPSEGHTLPEAYDSHLLQAFHQGKLEESQKASGRNPRYEFYWYTTGRLLTALAREKLITVALEAGCDYCMMYDDDMIIPSDMTERLLQDMEDHPEIDVLGALAFMRNPPHYAVIYVQTEGYDPILHQSYFHNEFSKNYPKDSLVECDAVGFGAALIRLDTVRKMKPPYFFSTTGSGEDIYFCYQVKKAGGRVFMDTRVKLGHLSSPKIIDENTFEEYAKEHNLDLGEDLTAYRGEAR